MLRSPQFDISSRSSLADRVSIRSATVAFIYVLLATLTACGGGGGGSTSTPPPPQATLYLTTLPSSISVYPASGFQLNVKASVSGTTALPSITLGTLPAGITTKSTFPMTVPDSGVTIDFEVASNMAAGTYSILTKGTAGSATATSSTSVTVLAGTPSAPYFVSPSSREFAVARGSSTSLQLQVMGSSTMKVVLSATGLPPGTTATFSRQEVQTGDSFTVTIAASSDAPVAHNVIWSVAGTPDANVQMPSLQLLLNITGTSDVGWNNRTDYVSTRSTPSSAAYDPVHQLIYASNPAWNRVDIISAATRSLLRSVPIRGPKGLDISIDQKRVWVATSSRIVYAIDTTTFQATRYQLPRFKGRWDSSEQSWEGYRVLSLADGTVYLQSTSQGGTTYNAIWDPVDNTLTQAPTPPHPADWGLVARSGDGKRLFSVGPGQRIGVSFVYDVLNKTLGDPVLLGDYPGPPVASPDGARVAIVDGGLGFNLYDGNLKLIGPLPGPGGISYPENENDSLQGGAVFSADGKTLYEETPMGGWIPLLVTIDVASREATGMAPAMPVIPYETRMSPPFFVPVPFAVDSTGMVLGIQYHGIAFDDSLAHINFVAGQPGTPTLMQHMTPLSGPVTGGTNSGGFGDGSWLKPDVYYGSAKGTATLSNTSVRITSPPVSVPGPVNVKLLFPDGIQIFNPQFFTYGVHLQDVILSGAPPDGNVPGLLDGFGLADGFGLPLEAEISVGGNRATTTSTATGRTAEQTASYRSFTVPPGSPGWTDITATTANGTGTLPKAFFYAKSVTDHSSPDAHTFILYDRSRNCLFLSAGDHINVFSLGSSVFLPPIQPPAIGSNKQFNGLALTPDKRYLLAANLSDSSLAVINPDAPADSFVVAIPKQSLQAPDHGPLLVAAADHGEAIVISRKAFEGGYQSGQVYVVSLTARTAVLLQRPRCEDDAASVRSTADGSLVALGGSHFGLYSAAQQQCLPPSLKLGIYNLGAAAAADGNVFAASGIFVDSSGNIVGKTARPPVFRPDGQYWFSSVLNDAGSLHYWAYPDYVDIVDVQHGLQALRFSLGRKVRETVWPMEVDADGQHIYLITDKGLTIVDLGHAPLSIGHLSQSTATTGADIVIRGSGFENGTTLTIGGRAAAVTYTDSSTLTFTVPSVDAGLQDLVLANPNGITYTLENGLTVQ